MLAGKVCHQRAGAVGNASEAAGVGQVQMPGVGGVQHVVGELRAQLGQTQADFLVTRLCGGGKTNAAALKVFQRVVDDFAP